ncbi:Transposase [Nitrosomonas sp. Nm51]|uniref:IS110 family transposase n=1 Tax=Nitrosomonas sp. Nm51 TaxID=133720 RepID=UPI0008C56048|nr:IS110 family transposase [Nitrosomonas sp. Nm51]SER78748.1 Transposase [Nitrosomonas sp. Nm51]
MTTALFHNAYIGLDVHKETIAIAIADPERAGEIRFWGNINNTPDSVRRTFTKLQNKYSSPLLCYEAGPCGYQLYRQLTLMGLECQVVAPSRIPRSPTDRIKNDHRDAVALARLLRSGDLTTVWVPDETHEAMRDLVRARSASKKDTKIARQRIQSLLLRAGRIYDKKSWTKRHRIWLANQTFPNASQQIAFQHYIQALEQSQVRTEQLEQEIDRLLEDWSLKDLVIQLQALRGIATIIAVTVVAEIGDFSRFDHPKQMMAYLGLIPGEYSSGNTTRSKGITKVGNKEVRRLLYEAAWSYRNNAKVGSWMLAHTPSAVTQVSKDIAWKAQQRLCFRYRSLAAKGKKSQVSITAVARELLGFMWDIVRAYRQQYSTV